MSNLVDVSVQLQFNATHTVCSRASHYGITGMAATQIHCLHCQSFGRMCISASPFVRDSCTSQNVAEADVDSAKIPW